MKQRLGAAVLLIGLLGAPVVAQDKQFDAAEGLYAVYELSQGGRPLESKLFGHGWPTDKAHLRITRELAGKNSDLLMAVYLASKSGLALSASDYEFARKERKVKEGEKLTSPLVLLSSELKTYRSMSGYTNSVRGFEPIFLPYRRSKANLQRTWDESDLKTWVWKKPKEETYTLEGLGYTLLAESSFAIDQLGSRRRERQQGRDVRLVGRTKRDGFFALLALNSACAKIWELRHKLILDMDARRLTPKSSLQGLNVKQYVFPNAWEAKVAGSSARYGLAQVENKLQSRLGAQAAVLLGVCQLAAACGPEAPAELRDLFASRGAGKGGRALFPRDQLKATIEVAIFSFQSMSKLHVSIKGSGRASSTADRYSRGGNITPTDLGLFLMSLEAFITQVKLPDVKKTKVDAFAKKLHDEQSRARRLIGALSGMILTWQQNQPGFYDAYSVRTSSKQVRTKSLASQAFAVRGLLATHRAVSRGEDDSRYLKAAASAIRWLDDQRWDEKARAYVEKDAKGTRRAPLFGAMAVLGALREMALETNDGRYLARYKQYLESLEAGGLFREAQDTIAPRLSSQVEFK